MSWLSPPSFAPRRIPERRTAKVAREIGTSPAKGTERGASMQVTAAQRAQRKRLTNADAVVNPVRL